MWFANYILKMLFINVGMGQWEVVSSTAGNYRQPVGSWSLGNSDKRGTDKMDQWCAAIFWAACCYISYNREILENLYWTGGKIVCIEFDWTTIIFVR